MTEYIYIKPNEEYIRSEFHRKLIKILLDSLNFCFAVYTDINYHLLPNRDLTIVIPVYRYTRKDTQKHKEDNVIAVIEKMNELAMKKDWSKSDNMTKYVMRSLTILNVDLNKLIRIIYTSEEYDYDNYLMISVPKFEYPRLKTLTLNDGSMINILIDPYVEDKGIACDLSKNIDDTCFSYNILHVYEHIMTYSWRKINETDTIMLNGFTYPHGLCLIFAILKNNTQLLKYLYSYIGFYLKTRDVKFWKENESILVTERGRTISETQFERTYASFGRTDPLAYYENYNYEIFSTWSRDPFNVLLITNEDIEIDTKYIESKLDTSNLSEIGEITVNTYNYMPMETLYMRNWMQMYVKRMDPRTIVKEAMTLNNFNQLYGIDSVFISLADMDAIPFRTCLYPLLYLRDYVEDEQIEEYLHNTVLANNAFDIIQGRIWNKFMENTFSDKNNSKQKKCSKYYELSINGSKHRVKNLKHSKPISMITAMDADVAFNMFRPTNQMKTNRLCNTDCDGNQNKTII